TLYQLPLLWRELNIFPEREGLPQSLLHSQQRVFYLLQRDACQTTNSGDLTRAAMASQAANKDCSRCAT
ncbi:hypothetical protein, partial [Vibrio cholerae]|uniref:hypothetical protein n=1 Tax=Vibrio cholerae TaxID=666 RepID=UPI003080BA3C